MFVPGSSKFSVLKCSPVMAAGEGHKEAKKRVKQEELSRVAKVVGLSKLKTKYESHESKRQLCAAYDLFVADERIIPSLPKLLGAPPVAHALYLPPCW